MQAIDLFGRRLLSTTTHWEWGCYMLMTLLRRYHNGLRASVELPDRAKIVHVQGHGQLLHPMADLVSALPNPCWHSLQPCYDQMGLSRTQGTA